MLNTCNHSAQETKAGTSIWAPQGCIDKKIKINKTSNHKAYDYISENKGLDR